ncbi:unnamed protein product [Oreochromis niloticus]|nr:unnamed protein product [Mustela putorius furo]
MASTSITTIGGVMVVTQVIPKDDGSIQLQNAGISTTPAPPPVKKTTPIPVKMDDMTVAFMRGQPHALGVVQIMIGLLCILFGLTAVYSWAMIAYSPFALGAAFVVSGSVALAAGRRTSISLVWGSLVSNVISVLIGLAGVAYTCWLLAECPPSYRFCDRQSFIEFKDVEDLRRRCSQNFYTLDVSLSLSLVLRAGLSVHLRSGLGVFPEDRSRLFLVCISCFIFPVSGGSLRAPRPLPGSPRPADLRHHRRLCFLWESHPAPHTIFSQRGV